MLRIIDDIKVNLTLPEKTINILKEKGFLVEYTSFSGDSVFKSYRLENNFKTIIQDQIIEYFRSEL